MTTEEQAAVEANLTFAKTQYHKLITGQTPRVIVDQNGERVEFNTANSAKLQAYIASLEALLRGPSALAAIRPIGFLF